MGLVRQLVGAHKVVASVTVGTVLVVGAVGGAAVAQDPATATVTKIVDGDTIDVVHEGRELRVRLLNVDTPEIDECLAEDAADFLEGRIPPGTEVELEWDQGRQDRYGRELTGVLEGDSLVNAEIARAGLGVAVLFEPNDRFYDEVLAAQEAAEAAGIGLFADDVACTVPAQVREHADAVADLHAGPGTLEEIDGWAAEAAAVAATGVALAGLLDGDGSVFPLVAYRSDRWTSLRDDVARDNGRVAEVQERLATERTDEERRIERENRAEAERKAKEEAERKAQEEAERQAQEETERQAREAAEEAAREGVDRQAHADEEARRRQSASTSMSTSGGGPAPAPAAPSAYYKNCSAARAAGAAPVVVGQPGYGRHLDRDGDGVGCE